MGNDAWSRHVCVAANLIHQSYHNQCFSVSILKTQKRVSITLWEGKHTIEHTASPYWLWIHILLSLIDWISGTHWLRCTDVQSLYHIYCFVTDIAEWSLYAKATWQAEVYWAAMAMTTRHNTSVMYVWLELLCLPTIAFCLSSCLAHSRHQQLL